MRKDGKLTVTTILTKQQHGQYIRPGSVWEGGPGIGVVIIHSFISTSLFEYQFMGVEHEVQNYASSQGYLDLK